MNFIQFAPEKGMVVQIDSTNWYVWDGTMWRPMTVEEQLAYSEWY